MISDKDADNFDENYFETDIKKIENFVVDRMKGINTRSFSSLRDESDLLDMRLKILSINGRK